MSMRARLWGAAALALVLAAPAGSAEVTADTVVATVNGTEITIGHMIAVRETLPPDYLALPDDVLFNGILDQMIQQVALSQEAEGSITRRDELLLENERRAYLAGAALDEVAGGAVSEDALKAAYDERFADAEPQKEFNAAHILVETEEAAQELKDKIDAGADFTELAREASTGPSGPNGGELGWFGLGMMVKPFEDAVLALEPGQVSGPVQTQFGWHVVKLNETRLAETPTLDEVRDELGAELRQKAVEAKLAAVTEAADVTRSAEGIDPTVIKDSALLGE